MNGDDDNMILSGIKLEYIMINYRYLTESSVLAWTWVQKRSWIPVKIIINTGNSVCKLQAMII